MSLIEAFLNALSRRRPAALPAPPEGKLSDGSSPLSGGFSPLTGDPLAMGLIPALRNALGRPHPAPPEAAAAPKAPCYSCAATQAIDARYWLGQGGLSRTGSGLPPQCCRFRIVSAIEAEEKFDSGRAVAIARPEPEKAAAPPPPDPALTGYTDRHPFLRGVRF
jgi:hypothetical protein